MTHDYKAALDAFNTFDGMTFNGNIEAWQKLGQLLDGHRKTIRSALQLAQEAERLRKERDELAEGVIQAYTSLNDSYETEYDGRVYEICSWCGGQDGQHEDNCEKENFNTKVELAKKVSERNGNA